MKLPKMKNMEKIMTRFARKETERARAKHKRAMNKMARQLDVGVRANSRGWV